MNSKSLIISIILCSSLNLIAQEAITYTKSFTNKLQRNGIDFFQPVERWLHVAHIREDDYIGRPEAQAGSRQSNVAHPIRQGQEEGAVQQEERKTGPREQHY